MATLAVKHMFFVAAQRWFHVVRGHDQISSLGGYSVAENACFGVRLSAALVFTRVTHSFAILALCCPSVRRRAISATMPIGALTMEILGAGLRWMMDVFLRCVTRSPPFVVLVPEGALLVFVGVGVGVGANP